MSPPRPECEEERRKIAALEEQLASAQRVHISEPTKTTTPTQTACQNCEELRRQLTEAQEALARRERDFVKVPVESKELAALRKGMDEFVRRNPTADTTIKTIETYARQFQSGM